MSDSGEVWKGILHDTKWAVSSLQFSFPTSASYYASTYGDEEPDAGFEALNSVQKNAVRSLYNDIESFTNLTFTEVTESSTTHAELRFAMTTNNTPTAVGYFPYGSDEAGDSWYNNDGSYDDPRLGTFAYNEGFMHEIGHTLGLRHGHDTGNPYGALPTNVDSNEFSVMTYRDHVGDSIDYSENEFGGNAQSYMMYDIAALQYMYGADYSASGNVWSGDTVYTFDPSSGQMSINGAGQGTPVANRIFRTIWDGNGVDTYDLSNYTTELNINLNPGEWSTFSQAQLADLDGGSRSDNLARGNVANALLSGGDLRSLIENANGGSGNDTIIGNQGSNELRGNGGNDNLQGGDGRDKAIYSGAYSEYSITKNGDGSFTIAHTGGDHSDGTDTVRDIEYAVFSDREVALTPLTGPLDVVFLQDLTGSFSDDLVYMRSAVDDIAATIQNAYANSRFAITSFRDTGDSYVYRVEADFTQSTSSLVSTYNSMTASGGGDTLEAQLTALLEASTDSALSYQSGSTRIFILATDAGYHDYENISSIASLMASNDIIPIFAVASGEVSTYQNLANELGTGVVVTIESDSTDFADSIRYALASIDGEVTEAGTSSSDTLAGGETADGIYGLGGDDSIAGNGGDDLLDGGSGNDSLLGGDDNDQLLGGSGNDTLVGGEGNDRLLGGDGDDVLLGDGESSSVVFPSAQSLNSLFTSGFDEDIQNSTTQTHATVQGTGDGTVKYYSFTVAAAGLSVVLDIDYANQNIGGSSDFDSWIVLYDGSGNQLTYDDDSAGDDPGSVSSEDSYLSHTLGSAGTYYVAVGSYWNLSTIPVGGTYELHVSVDGAIGAPPAVGPGNDVLNGGEGADSMAGGAGNDVYYVDDVGDTIEESAGNGNDQVFSYISFALRDHSQDLEHLNLLGAGNINGTGNGLGNSITGNSGNNVLNGAYGNDILRGGAGNDIFKDDNGADRMIGGTGNDVYYVDNVGDTIEESAGNGTDQVFSYISFALRDHSQDLEHLSLLGSGNINGTGNGLGNSITGNSGNNVLNGAYGNDILRGGAGNDIFKDDNGADRMIGGAGNDVYYVDNVGDTIEESAGNGTDQVFSYISFALRDHSQDLEHLSLLGSGNINGTGNGLNNIITGNSGNNVLNGAYGNDTLRGGAGNDIFKDDNGADRMIGGTGNDVYYVDNVGDTIEESAGNGTDQVFSYISFALRDHSQDLEHLSLLGSGNINGTGNGLNNVITGNSGNNVLNGAYGNDILRGGAGNDIFDDDNGNDIFSGGTGADTFVFRNAGDYDIITDFEDGIDKISIATGSHSFSQVKILDSGANTIVQFDGSTVVLNNFNHALLGADDFLFV
nr:M10 family metallopeptidase C-terminal domain-containing protein [uncultured Cohaesibacter sp.]